MKPTPARFAATPDYADLHRHLGGAVHPKILYGYLHDHTADAGVTPQERDWIHRLLTRFPEYESLRAYFSFATRDVGGLSRTTQIGGTAPDSRSNGLLSLPHCSWRTCV